MPKKGFVTKIQAVKNKYTVSIPMALVILKGIEKGDKLLWSLDDENRIGVRVVKP